MVAAGLLGLPGPKSLRQLADVVTARSPSFMPHSHASPIVPLAAARASVLRLPPVARAVHRHVRATRSHKDRAPRISRVSLQLRVDFVSDSSIVRSLLSTYYASLPLLPRGLPLSAAYPPAAHGGSCHPLWRFPADRSLFAAHGSDLLFWDHGTEQRRDKPAARLSGGGGGRSGGGSPRAGQRLQPWPPVEEATDAAPS